MKRFFSYVMASVLCLFFFFAGSGLNVVHYCCDDCRAAGIAGVEAESCSAIHQSKHHSDCCHHDMDSEHHDEDCGGHSDCCWFKHLEVNQCGISSSYCMPKVMVINLLYATALTDDNLYSFNINADCERDICFDISPNEDDSGRAVILRVCSWLI